MAKKQSIPGSGDILQFTTGLALFFVGLLGIVNYNSDLNEIGRSLAKTFGGKSDVLDLVFAMLLMASGLLLACALFLSVDKKILFLSTFVVLAIWVIRIIMVYFSNDVFEPDFLVWVTPLTVDLVILSSIWAVTRKYA